MLQNTSSISNKDQLFKDTKTIQFDNFAQGTSEAQNTTSFQTKALIWNEGFPGNFLHIKPNAHTLRSMQYNDYTYSY